MGANFSSHPGSQPPTTSTREGSMPQQDSACPVPEPYRNPAVFNVYSQRVNDPACPIAGPQMDPRNNMPLEPNQQPAPGQRALISTSREQSAIPKGGTDGTWLYPSPQMFFNGAPCVQLGAHGAECWLLQRPAARRQRAGLCSRGPVLQLLDERARTMAWRSATWRSLCRHTMVRFQLRRLLLPAI